MPGRSHIKRQLSGERHSLGNAFGHFSRRLFTCSADHLIDMINNCFISFRVFKGQLQLIKALSARAEPAAFMPGQLDHQLLDEKLLGTQLAIFGGQQFANRLRITEKIVVSSVLQDEGLLRVRELRCLHRSSLRSQPGSGPKNLQLQTRNFSGSRPTSASWRTTITWSSVKGRRFKISPPSSA